MDKDTKKETTMNDLALMIGKGFQNVDKKFEKIEEKIDKVETKLEKKIDNVETKLERKIDKVSTDIQDSKKVKPIKKVNGKINKVANSISGGKSLSKKKAEAIIKIDPFKESRAAAR